MVPPNTQQSCPTPFLSFPPFPHSILRAGESMEAPLREWLPAAVIGKVLIQRDESTAQPILFYNKLPPNITSLSVLLLVQSPTAGVAPSQPRRNAIFLP